MSALCANPVTTAAGLEALCGEWTDLCERAGGGNPFVHPQWLMPWARHHTRPRDLYMVAVRDGAGRLQGIAPFYWRHYPLGPGLVASALQLLGSGPFEMLSELPQVVAAPGHARAVLRAVFAHLCAAAPRWDWCEVTLSPDQGWLEPAWLDGGPRERAFAVQKGTRACVMLPLPASWEALHGALKRNVKESIRHGHNSLTRDRHRWEITIPDAPDDRVAAVRAVMDLHRRRGGLNGKVHHADYFANPRAAAFIAEATPELVGQGRLTPVLLTVGGRPVAGRCVLFAQDDAYLSFSGFDPAWWDYGVATTVLVGCLRHAIARGARRVNLSTGPETSKLRWSEDLRMYQDFYIAGPGRRARLAFGLYQQARTAAVVYREGRRYARA